MTVKQIGLITLAGVVVGLLGGFVPEYIAKSHAEQRATDLTNQGAVAQQTLHRTQRQLCLNGFALQAAVVSADANSSNYADASASASGLFTNLRDYVDNAGDDASKQAISDVLSTRDTTISGLAKADPGVRPVINQTFQKLKQLTEQPKS